MSNRTHKGFHNGKNLSEMDYARFKDDVMMSGIGGIKGSLQDRADEMIDIMRACVGNYGWSLHSMYTRTIDQNTISVMYRKRNRRDVNKSLNFLSMNNDVIRTIKLEQGNSIYPIEVTSKLVREGHSVDLKGSRIIDRHGIGCEIKIEEDKWMVINRMDIAGMLRNSMKVLNGSMQINGSEGCNKALCTLTIIGEAKGNIIRIKLSKIIKYIVNACKSRHCIKVVKDSKLVMNDREAALLVYSLVAIENGKSDGSCETMGIRTAHDDTCQYELGRIFKDNTKTPQCITEVIKLSEVAINISKILDTKGRYMKKMEENIKLDTILPLSINKTHYRQRNDTSPVKSRDRSRTKIIQCDPHELIRNDIEHMIENEKEVCQEVKDMGVIEYIFSHLLSDESLSDWVITEGALRDNKSESALLPEMADPVIGKVEKWKIIVIRQEPYVMLINPNTASIYVDIAYNDIDQTTRGCSSVVDCRGSCALPSIYSTLMVAGITYGEQVNDQISRIIDKKTISLDKLYDVVWRDFRRYIERYNMYISEIVAIMQNNIEINCQEEKMILAAKSVRVTLDQLRSIRCRIEGDVGCYYGIAGLNIVDGEEESKGDVKFIGDSTIPMAGVTLSYICKNGNSYGTTPVIITTKCEAHILYDKINFRDVNCIDEDEKVVLHVGDKVNRYRGMKVYRGRWELGKRGDKEMNEMYSIFDKARCQLAEVIKMRGMNAFKIEREKVRKNMSEQLSLSIEWIESHTLKKGKITKFDGTRVSYEEVEKEREKYNKALKERSTGVKETKTNELPRKETEEVKIITKSKSEEERGDTKFNSHELKDKHNKPGRENPTREVKINDDTSNVTKKKVNDEDGLDKDGKSKTKYCEDKVSKVSIDSGKRGKKDNPIEKEENVTCAKGVGSMEQDDIPKNNGSADANLKGMESDNVCKQNGTSKVQLAEDEVVECNSSAIVIDRINSIEKIRSNKPKKPNRSVRKFKISKKRKRTQVQIKIIQIYEKVLKEYDTRGIHLKEWIRKNRRGKSITESNRRLTDLNKNRGHRKICTSRSGIGAKYTDHNLRDWVRKNRRGKQVMCE